MNAIWTKCAGLNPEVTLLEGAGKYTLYLMDRYLDILSEQVLIVETLLLMLALDVNLAMQSS